MANPKKVLLIGETKSNSGYARALNSYAFALDAVGYDVAMRNVSMTAPRGELDPKIKAFLEKPINDIGTVFQFNLPTEFSYTNGNFQNIAGFAYETNCVPIAWINHLRPFKKIVVPSSSQKNVLKNYDLESTVIAHAIDKEKFNPSNPFDKMEFNAPENCVKFYTVSEFNRRKNVHAIIAAYLMAFTSSDNVLLVLKCHIPGLPPDKSHKIIKQNIEEIKQNLRRFDDPNRYPKIVLPYGYMTEDQLNNLHRSCEVFVSASRGEAFCFPAFDAYGFGKRLLLSNTGSLKDYFELQENVYFIEGSNEPCIGAMDGLPGVYTPKEEWFNVNLRDFVNKLRHIYDYYYNEVPNIPQQREYLINNFSYEAIGQKFGAFINE